MQPGLLQEDVIRAEAAAAVEPLHGVLQNVLLARVHGVTRDITAF